MCGKDRSYKVCGEPFHFIPSLIYYNVPCLRYIGEINYFSVNLAASHWSFPWMSLMVPDTTILGACTGIIEHLSALNLLEPDAFQAYQQATGATLDESVEFRHGLDLL
jgi:hypothetical protein